MVYSMYGTYERIRLLRAYFFMLHTITHFYQISKWGCYSAFPSQDIEDHREHWMKIQHLVESQRPGKTLSTWLWFVALNSIERYRTDVNKLKLRFDKCQKIGTVIIYCKVNALLIHRHRHLVFKSPLQKTEYCIIFIGVSINLYSQVQTD